MAKQTFTSGQVLTAQEMNDLQENDYNWTVTTKTASYTLAAGDEGTRIVMDSASATTITVDDAIFAAGDVIWIHNIGAGTVTVTAGTATVNTAGGLGLALGQYAGGQLYFTSASAALFFPNEAGGTLPYADASARTTAVPSPVEGQMSYLKDTNTVEVYDGSAWAAVGGKILQVVSTTKTDTFSTSSTSLTDITGLSVAITPSATSSKILIILSLSQIGMNADNWFFGDVTRAGTPIGVGDSAGSRTPSSWAASTTGANRPDNCNWHFLDSPNTTSATTYQARVRVAGNTVYINRHSVDTDSPGYPRSVSSITALEVSA